MFKKKSFSIIKKVFLIGICPFLIGTELSFLAPKSIASQGLFEFQWDPDPSFRRLKSLQTSSDPMDRSNYYLFLRSSERKTGILQLTVKLPDYFQTNLKEKKISLC